MTLLGAVSSPTMATRGHTIKYSVEHRLKDGAFESAMMDSLTNQFLPRALPVLKKHKILRYVVVSVADLRLPFGRLRTDTIGHVAKRGSRGWSCAAGRSEQGSFDGQGQ